MAGGAVSSVPDSGNPLKGGFVRKGYGEPVPLSRIVITADP